MRRGLTIFLVINAIIVLFLIRSVYTLLTLLIEDGSEDAIHSAEIPAPNSPLIEDRPQLIPKIIHQTYVNDSVPEHWREAQKSCIDLHTDYEYKVRSYDSELVSKQEPILLTDENRDRLTKSLLVAVVDGRQIT